LKAVPEDFQGAVVFEEVPVYFGKTFQKGGVGAMASRCFTKARST
jgi:hypothetical protein